MDNDRAVKVRVAAAFSSVRKPAPSDTAMNSSPSSVAPAVPIST
jgi:hypothetical protein